MGRQERKKSGNKEGIKRGIGERRKTERGEKNRVVGGKEGGGMHCERGRKKGGGVVTGDESWGEEKGAGEKGGGDEDGVESQE